MKKILSSLIFAFVLLSLFSCVKNPYACEEIYGVIKYSEEAERLIVYIPKYGDVEIPESDSTYASFNGPEKVNTPYTLKEGDLVKISFVYVKAHDDAGVCVMETYPAKFDRKADTVEALRERVVLEKDEDGFILSFYQDNRDGLAIGDNANLVQHFNSDGKERVYIFGDARVIDINGDRITVKIQDIEDDFIEKLASARLERPRIN